MRSLTTRRSRGLLRAGLTLAAVAAACAPEPAAAYETFTTGGCTALTWTSQPRVVVHTGELPTGSENAGDNLRMLAAVAEVNDALNDVNATSAQITSTTTSTAPFTQEVWFNDATPTIHVGFHNDPDGKLGSGGPGRSVGCRYDEAHIGFKNLDFNDPSDTWNFGTPEDEGKAYYDMTQNDAGGDRYFRLAYLHELLHTFGLNHSDSSYSMLNYGDRPWSDEDTIRPLPDDVAGLRELYPQPNVGTSEVAVFNTFYTQAGATNGAAQQERLCKPSLGDFFWADMFGDYCGITGPNWGSTQICPGSSLRTRFTIGNYSTEDADLTARLWLSRDEEWDSSDLVSPTRYEDDVPSTHSHHESATFEVPYLGFTPSADYHLILRVRGTTTSGRSVESWTPLRGTVEHELAQCLTAEPADPDVGDLHTAG